MVLSSFESMTTFAFSRRQPNFVTCFSARSVELYAGRSSTALSGAAALSQSILGHGAGVHGILAPLLVLAEVFIEQPDDGRCHNKNTLSLSLAMTGTLMPRGLAGTASPSQPLIASIRQPAANRIAFHIMPFIMCFPYFLQPCSSSHQLTALIILQSPVLKKTEFFVRTAGF